MSAPRDGVPIGTPPLSSLLSGCSTSVHICTGWTVVDCFRVRNKSGLDVALEALREGRSQHRFTMDDLWRRATRGRVANAMRPYVEVITA